MNQHVEQIPKLVSNPIRESQNVHAYLNHNHKNSFKPYKGKSKPSRIPVNKEPTSPFQTL